MTNLVSSLTMDKRRQDVVTLLEFAPLKATDVVLDMGLGDGQIAATLVQRVKRVVGIGLNVCSYGIDATKLRQTNVTTVECNGELLPFSDDSFGAVVMSHILEHMPNVGWALSEVRRVLMTNGLLCVFVPPFEPAVAGGHISVGWNVGQLMYVLAINGFDTAHGHYARYGYNICAFVRKDFRPLPPLRHDFGDLRTLADDGRFPVPLGQRADGREAFRGELDALNWPWTQLFPPPYPPRKRSLFGKSLRKLISPSGRHYLARLLARGIGALTDEILLPANGINPTALDE